MRFAALVILELCLALPAMAQTSQPPQTIQTTQPDANGHAFGSANCPTRVMCPDDNPVATEDILSIANSCINRYFGYSSPSGFFDGSRDLDGRSCLTPIPNILPKGVGAPLAPLCCIIKMPDSTCIVHCDLISQ